MDEFDTDIFTFRQSDGGIVNDVVSKQGFADDALLDAFTEEDVKDIIPLVLGYQYLSFN